MVYENLVICRTIYMLKQSMNKEKFFYIRLNILYSRYILELLWNYAETLLANEKYKGQYCSNVQGIK
ncbi:hypothetical protein DND47_29745 [Pseudomonas syringae pv. syringae]|nr:hypothetical protein DND47_29745 [Pseudomonas syringae pv. syringae]